MIFVLLIVTFNTRTMLVLYILSALFALVLMLNTLAPKTYEVYRSITINRPKKEVFEYLKSLKNMDEWSPWSQRDPQMQKSFSGTDGEVGAMSSWKGNKQVGEGEQEIIEIVEGERINSQLRFIKPWKSTSEAFLITEEDHLATKVTWGFKGRNQFPFTWFTLFMSMDKMIGKDFDQGLTQLKKRLEI